MEQSAAFRSGKGHRDENFPVASRLVSAKHRAIIMAFYDFARTADDIADHPSLPREDKLHQLDRMRASLTGETSDDTVSVRLRECLETRSLGPRHALDLLIAFRRDVTKNRYADWDELIDYCSYSAMPVGRFVLDVHGENASTWPASDTLCAALQIINHLQDCGKDYRDLDRVYIPQDALIAAGTATDALGGHTSSPALLDCLHRLAGRTEQCLASQASLSRCIADLRLACEVAAIEALAYRLLSIIQQRDPLRDKVHLGRGTLIGVLVAAVSRTLGRRMISPWSSHKRPQDVRS
ncbi:MAG: squalene synthase HpnC [Pseudorhodoplanes sp.]|uniref:squalene synthase HpnC n=1 Tax=Pseudorhodoplanes sp. TaxID=1934341 RepID=UPI003D0E12C1